MGFSFNDFIPLNHMLEIFLLTFIPVFVAMDAIGIIPLYLGLTEKIEKSQKRTLIINASLTAFFICTAFIIIGDALFSFLGITENDFRIAGGIILLIIAINDLLFYSSRTRDIEPEDVGIVPIGIPLIAGPAVLTSLLIIKNEYGYIYTFISLFLNILISYIALRNADRIKKLLGESGSKAFAKIVSLFLAAIAIMMIRVGIMNAINF
jgi:multiple antibiotic resistance protein